MVSKMASSLEDGDCLEQFLVFEEYRDQEDFQGINSRLER